MALKMENVSPFVCFFVLLLAFCFCFRLHFFVVCFIFILKCICTKTTLKAIHREWAQTGILKQWSMLLNTVRTTIHDVWTTTGRWRGRRHFDRFREIYIYMPINLFSCCSKFINIQICQRDFFWNFAFNAVFIMIL